MSPHDWSYLKGLQRLSRRTWETKPEEFEDENEFDDTSRYLPATVLPLEPDPLPLAPSQVSPSPSPSLSSTLLNNNSNKNNSNVSRPNQTLSCSISRSINSQVPDGSLEVQEEEATCTTIEEANSNQTALIICPDQTCAKQFRDETGLRYELQVMLPSIPARLTRSRRHSKIHSGEGRVYPCGVAGCHFASRWRKDLRTHMSTHVKSFPCEVPGCDKSYKRRDNYLRHVRARHVDSGTAAATLGAISRPDRLPRPSQPTTLSARKPKKNAGEGGALSIDSVPNHTTSDSKRFTNERLDDNLVSVSPIWSKPDIPWSHQFLTQTIMYRTFRAWKRAAAQSRR